MSSAGGPNAGAIAGGVVGGLAAIAIIVLILFCCRRRRRRQAQQNTEVGSNTYENKRVSAEPEMRQSAPLGAAAVLRRATRSQGPAPTHPRHPSRSSFDILGGPAASTHTLRSVDLETPSSLTDEGVDPFVSPFPAPPPRTSFERSGPNAVAWGQARESGIDSTRHARGLSNASMGGLGLGGIETTAAAPPALLPAPVLTPLSTTPTGAAGSRHSRKISGTYSETPPETPVMRTSTLTSRSPVYPSPSSGTLNLNRWAVDEDPHIGSINGSNIASPDRPANRSTTYLQHHDAGPGQDIV